MAFTCAVRYCALPVARVLTSEGHVYLRPPSTCAAAPINDRGMSAAPRLRGSAIDGLSMDDGVFDGFVWLPASHMLHFQVRGPVVLARNTGWALSQLLRPEAVRMHSEPLSSDTLTGFSACRWVDSVVGMVWGAVVVNTACVAASVAPKYVHMPTRITSPVSRTQRSTFSTM